MIQKIIRFSENKELQCSVLSRKEGIKCESNYSPVFDEWECEDSCRKIHFGKGIDHPGTIIHSSPGDVMQKKDVFTS